MSGESAQSPNRLAVGANGICREKRTRRLIHEGHEFVGKPGIVQPIQIPPTFGQPPIPVSSNPVSRHYTEPLVPSIPISQYSVRIAIALRELSLFIVSATIASLVNGVTE